jgi:hypothetical protein
MVETSYEAMSADLAHPDHLSIIKTPLFYWCRICLCYWYYLRTLWRVPFNRKWLRVPGMDHNK